MNKKRPNTTRYTTPTSAEAQYQPGSRKRVLLNKQGISSLRGIGYVESALLLEAQNQYIESQISPNTIFTTALIRRMHFDWLGPLYDWAGSYRAVNVSKNGFAWPPAYRIPDLMEQLESEVLRVYTPCRVKDLNKVSEAIAIVHGELLLVHPFREGNGRIARWVADLMAMQAGFPPPMYRFSGRGSVHQRAVYLAAVKNSYLKNYRDLSAFFSTALRDAVAAAERRSP